MMSSNLRAKGRVEWRVYRARSQRSKLAVLSDSRSGHRAQYARRNIGAGQVRLDS